MVTVRTLTSTTGSKSGGFTLVEIVAAITVVGLVLALAMILWMLLFAPGSTEPFIYFQF